MPVYEAVLELNTNLSNINSFCHKDDLPTQEELYSIVVGTGVKVADVDVNCDNNHEYFWIEIEKINDNDMIGIVHNNLTGNQSYGKFGSKIKLKRENIYVIHNSKVHKTMGKYQIMHKHIMQYLASDKQTLLQVLEKDHKSVFSFLNYGFQFEDDSPDECKYLNLDNEHIIKRLGLLETIMTEIIKGNIESISECSKDDPIYQVIPEINEEFIEKNFLGYCHQLHYIVNTISKLTFIFRYNGCIQKKVDILCQFIDANEDYLRPRLINDDENIDLHDVSQWTCLSLFDKLAI